MLGVTTVIYLVLMLFVFVWLDSVGIFGFRGNEASLSCVRVCPKFLFVTIFFCVKEEERKGRGDERDGTQEHSKA